MIGLCLFIFKLALRSTWMRYHRWCKVCSEMYLMKKSFNLEAIIWSYVHPSHLCDVSSVGGRLSTFASNSRHISLTDGVISTLCGCRANLSIFRLNVSFEAICNNGYLSKYTLLYIYILSDCFKGDNIGAFE